MAVLREATPSGDNAALAAAPMEEAAFMEGEAASMAEEAMVAAVIDSSTRGDLKS